MAETCVRVRVGAEEYALPVRFVPEVADLGEITPVPGAPAQVLGIRNLRGEVLPVFDPAPVLGAAGGAAPTRLVVAEADGRRCALAVVEVLEVADLEREGDVAVSPLLTGAALLDGRLVGMVDVAALLEALAPEAAA
jgi:purine-binding chemotaxis protein CheW